MGNPFRSFGAVPLVNQPDRLPSKSEMVADLTEEMCAVIKAQRAEAKRREEACEEPMLETPELVEAYQTLDALAKGPHAWMVKPILLEQFPELAAAPSDAEQAAVARYLADNPTQGAS